MVTIADFLDPESRQEYVSGKLAPGRVLYLFSRFSNPAKDKYLVLVCLGPHALLLVINSRISQYVDQRQHLLSCQVSLRATDYGFLDHDSYIDCSKVITDFHEQTIRDQLLADTSRIKGELGPITKGLVLQAIRSARTISPLHKELIRNAFE